MNEQNSKHSLLKESTKLFIATMTANICGFVFQLYMGRRLSYDDFGVLNSLLSFTVIMAVPATTLQFVIAKYVSNFKAKDDYAKIKYLILKIIKKTGIYIIAGLAVFTLISKNIADFLQIDSVTPVIIAGFLLASSFIVPVLVGYLQGLQKFNYVGFSTGGSGVSRLFFGALLVGLGLGVNGALCANLLANFTVLAIAIYPLLFLSSYKEKAAVEGLRQECVSYSLYVMLAAICFNILTNIDLILVKHYFSPESAGLYSSVVVLGKTILYLPMVISVVMFPMVSEAHTIENDVFGLFNKSMAYTAGIVLTGFAGFLLFPEIILDLLYGGKFNNSAGLLQIFSFSMIFMVLINVIMNFNLARHSLKFIYSMVCGCALQVVLIILFHNTLKQVIFANIAAGAIVLVYNLVLITMEKSLKSYRIRKQITEER